MDVIQAAQAISVDGTKLCALAQQIANESADSQSKKDLQANLSKIPLYCQQLNICSKVNNSKTILLNLIYSGKSRRAAN